MRSHGARMTVMGLAMGVAAGCSGGEPPSSTGDTGPASVTSAAASATRTIALAVSGGKVTPAVGRVEVERGTMVRLVVTADVADELHVHGYDKDVELRAGRPVTLHWVADLPGVFDVETHRTGTVLVQLMVR